MTRWVQKAFGKNKGALHRELGYSKGAKIPLNRLRSAQKKGGKLGRRAQLAITARSFKH